MRKNIVLVKVMLFSLLSCSSQETKEMKGSNAEKKPEISWKVNKEYDENGNLIRYDSVYTWSLSEGFDSLSVVSRDSLLNSFESDFYRNFNQFKNTGFSNMFGRDSLFSKRFFGNEFFESDFGKDFLEMDRIQKGVIRRQQRFLEKYQSEFEKSK